MITEKIHIIFRSKTREDNKLSLCQANLTPYWYLNIKPDITQEEIDKCNCKRCLNSIKKREFLTEKWEKENVTEEMRRISRYGKQK